MTKAALPELHFKGKREPFRSYLQSKEGLGRFCFWKWWWKQNIGIVRKDSH